MKTIKNLGKTMRNKLNIIPTWPRDVIPTEGTLFPYVQAYFLDKTKQCDAVSIFRAFEDIYGFVHGSKSNFMNEIYLSKLKKTIAYGRKRGFFIVYINDNGTRKYMIPVVKVDTKDYEADLKICRKGIDDTINLRLPAWLKVAKNEVINARLEATMDGRISG